MQDALKVQGFVDKDRQIDELVRQLQGDEYIDVIFNKQLSLINKQNGPPEDDLFVLLQPCVYLYKDALVVSIQLSNQGELLVKYVKTNKVQV